MAKGIDDLIEKVGTVGFVGEGGFVADLVNVGDEVAVGVVGIEEVVASGVSNLCDPAKGVALPRDGAAGGRVDAGVGEGEDVVVAVGDGF